MSRVVETDILIIGAGIAGSALACALRNTHLKVAVLEKSGLALDTARGDHLQPRTCEILSNWNILDAFFEAGAEKRGQTIWRNANDEIFFSSRYDQLDVPEPYFAFLNHELIGEILLNSAASSGSIDLIKPCQQWSIVEHQSDSVVIDAVDDDGQSLTITSKILVGADGRGSKVRESAGFETQITRYNEPLVVLFGNSSNYPDNTDLNIYLRKNCMVTLIPRASGGFKIAIPEERSKIKSWKQATEDELKHRVKELLPELELDSVHFCDFYQPIDLRSSHWVNNNTVLIGDSCHAMHPARSLGMNLTIQNIEKLAKTLLGASPNKFNQSLSGYEQNNKPALDEILNDNHRYAEIMDSGSTDTFVMLERKLMALNNNPEALLQRLYLTAGYR